MQYRPEIDGLRAIAVVPVVAFHAGAGLFSGGYVGVDVFFVISGYLITTILAQAMIEGRFSLLTFYERRARRILPALFAVIACTIPFALAWMKPSQFEDFAQSIVAVVFFGSNILFWIEDGYFDFASEEKPLLHTWSLAVEEQYYIFFPLILLLVLRRGNLARALRAVLVLALISLAACQWAVSALPSANFYLAPFRAWELLAGSLCALYLLARPAPMRQGGVLAALGLGMVAVATFAFDNATPFPSIWALLPVLGTALIILGAHTGTWVARMLSTRAMVGIGLISYSTYLWHQPIFALARIRFADLAHGGGVETGLFFAALSLLSFALAWLSWRYVEQPFRRGAGQWCPGQARIFGASAAAAAVLLGFAGVALWKDGFAARFDALNLAGYQWNNMRLQTASWSRLDALSDTRRGPTGDPFDDTAWFDPDDPRARLLLIGNSHSKDLYNALIESHTVATRAQIARYGVQLRDLSPDHRFWQAPNYRQAGWIVLATRYDDADIAALPAAIARMQTDGKQVVIVANTPEFSGGQVVTLADEIVQPALMFGPKPDFAPLADRVNRTYWQDLQTSERQRRVTRINAQLRMIATSAGDVPVLDRLDYICRPAKARCDAMSDRLAKHLYDQAHTTLEGAAHFATRIDALDWFAPAGLPPRP